MRKQGNGARGLPGLGLSLELALTLGAAEGPTRSVFIAAGTFTPPPGDEKALAAKVNDADKAQKEKEKQLKAELGKKRETWPPEKEEELYGTGTFCCHGAAANAASKVVDKFIEDNFAQLGPK